MCSTRWKGAAGSTIRTFGGWTRATLPQATVPGWGKSWWGQSPSRISTRSPLFHSNELDTTTPQGRPLTLQIYLARVAAEARLISLLNQSAQVGIMESVDASLFHFVRCAYSVVQKGR